MIFFLLFLLNFMLIDMGRSYEILLLSTNGNSFIEDNIYKLLDCLREGNEI